MLSNWGKHTARTPAELNNETELEALEAVGDEERYNTFTSLVFDACRAGNANALENILTVDPSYATQELHGYEGSDLYDVVKSEDKKCYTFTGQIKDGFFYPLHVAAEGGFKETCLLLFKYGAKHDIPDSTGRTPEQKVNRDAKWAFYEHRGLKFEAKERYVGGQDSYGKRSGRGTLYYKPEGYLSEEKLYFRGNFKNGVYHGQGTLYWPGSTAMKYSGRFKDGLMHGRGCLFNEKGQKIYVGTLRSDERDGHGETYENVDGDYFMTYKGEFSGNKMHGFGVAHFSEGHNFAGRFENNLKAGIGVYSYPNGDRFEGMFFNDKPDGQGSYYSKGKDGKMTAQHYTWQAGRKMKETPETPFVPYRADMPEPPVLSTSKLMSDILKKAYDDRSGEGEGKGPGTGDGAATVKKDQNDHERKRAIFRRDSTKLCNPNTWKAELARCLRLPKDIRRVMGMLATRSTAGGPESAGLTAQPLEELDYSDYDSEMEDFDSSAAEVSTRRKGAGAGGRADNAGARDMTDDLDFADEDDVDEVLGTHFMSFSPLFVCYVYVCSAQKVFEKRWTDGLSDVGTHNKDHSTTDLESEELQELGGDGFDDGFESSYHLVIDAVDEYNSKWEAAYKIQTDMEEEDAERRKKEIKDEPGDLNKSGRRHKSESIYRLAESGKVTAATSERKKMFMNETEKRADQTRKQRAELAARKGTGTLAKDTERLLGLEVVENLEMELMELVSQPVSATATGTGTSAGNQDARDDVSVTSNSTMNSSTSPLRRTLVASVPTANVPKKDSSDNLLGVVGGEEGQDRGQVSSNEFAAELIHLLRLAKDSM